MTTPQDITAAARAMGRRGGKIGGKSRTEAKASASRANGAKGGKPYFTAATITPDMLGRVERACGSAAAALRRIAEDAYGGTIDTATAAKAANAVLRDIIKAARASGQYAHE